MNAEERCEPLPVQNRDPFDEDNDFTLSVESQDSRRLLSEARADPRLMSGTWPDGSVPLLDMQTDPLSDVPMSHGRALGQTVCCALDRLGTSSRNQHLQQSGRVTNACRDCCEWF
jgi:hypothetical protein